MSHVSNYASRLYVQLENISKYNNMILIQLNNLTITRDILLRNIRKACKKQNSNNPDVNSELFYFANRKTTECARD